MTARVMLDTNAVAALLKARSPILEDYARNRPTCVSVVTEAEVRYGLARRPEAAALRRVAEALLAAIEILPWNSACATTYGALRAQLEKQGKPLAPLDLLIASHALAIRCPLVTGDAAFTRVPGLSVVQWSARKVREFPERKPPPPQAEEAPARYRATSRRPQRKPRAMQAD